MGPQERALRAGVDIIVATPGRLLDHMRLNQVRFDQLHTLVLDEADQMLDMGFLPDLKRIIARLPARKHTLLFSATMPPVIVTLSRDICASRKLSRLAAQLPAVGITQAAYPVAEHLKGPLLRHLLRHTEMPLVLVFTRTKHSARRLAKTIDADGFAVAELHSNLTQAQRRRVMEGFRRGDYQVVVATNIAARGLDVDNITHVISYDVPDVPDDYVHRSAVPPGPSRKGTPSFSSLPARNAPWPTSNVRLARLPASPCPISITNKPAPTVVLAAANNGHTDPRADSAMDARHSKPPAATRKPVAPPPTPPLKVIGQGPGMPIVSQLILK